MDSRLADLLRQFELERLEVNLCRGESRDVGSPQVFGGQVLGQALMAAYATVEARTCIRRAAYCAAVISTRRSSTRSTARATAQLFVLACGRDPARRADLQPAASFQTARRDWTINCRCRTPPPGAAGATTTARSHQSVAGKLQRIFQKKRAFEFRSVEPTDYLHPRNRAAAACLAACGRAAARRRPLTAACCHVPNTAARYRARPHGTAWHAADLVMAA